MTGCSKRRPIWRAASSGTDKPLSCSASLLAKVAALRSPDMGALPTILGERRAERFGAAFLDVLESA